MREWMRCGLDVEKSGGGMQVRENLASGRFSARPAFAGWAVTSKIGNAAPRIRHEIRREVAQDIQMLMESRADFCGFSLPTEVRQYRLKEWSGVAKHALGKGTP